MSSELFWLSCVYPGQGTLVSYLFHLLTSPVKDFLTIRKIWRPPWPNLWVLCRGQTKGWSFQGSQWYQLNREILLVWTRLQGWFLGGTLWEPDREGSRWRIQGRNLDKRPNVIWKLHLCFYLYSSNYLRPVVLKLEYVSESPGGLLKLLLGPPSEFLIP